MYVPFSDACVQTDKGTKGGPSRKNDPKMMENTKPVELKDEALDNVAGGVEEAKAG